jgi:thiol-disulfide isomerase/thioredoxin
MPCQKPGMQLIVVWQLIIVSLCTSIVFAQDAPPSSSIAGNWTAALDTPGGKLEFGLEIETAESKLQAWIINGPERIKISNISVSDSNYEIDFDHYDSKIRFQHADNRLLGTWSKRRGKNDVAEMNFTADRKHQPVDVDDATPVTGRWKVKFEGEADSSVAVIKSMPDSNLISATFLTTTGDYRFLSGSLKQNELTLSCFDGAHAFLFKAKLAEDNTLAGRFYSGDWWQTTWTAVGDQDASLPDAFNMTSFEANSDLAKIRFPDVSGHPRSLMDKQFTGDARIIYVFGSWCPNCHDAAEFLVELDQEYGDKGLSILGLAFELTGDFDRDSKQVKKYLDRHNAQYPVLIAGISDKNVASQALPFLDKVRSYPTTIFLDRDGTIQAVHTGFSGPATGEAHEKLKRQFREQIERMLK